jgi:hypothetical protein
MDLRVCKSLFLYQMTALIFIFSDISVPCSKALKQLNRSTWSIHGSRVLYCLAEQFDEHCKIKLSPEIAWPIIVFNLVKACLLLYTFFLVTDIPLLTMGDAVASFLEHPDEMTRGLCWMSKKHVTSPAFRINHDRNGSIDPRSLNQDSQKWSSVVGKKRWMTYLCLFASFIHLQVLNLGTDIR